MKAIPGFINEAGGHRIQRIPPTERKGRVHTSTVTCAVLEDDDASQSSLYSKRSKDDFDYRWYSGTGKGGQHRNRHANCLELTHIPSGMAVSAQGRLRPTNERDAMALMLIKLDAAHATETAANQNNVRAVQVSSGMRGDKIRTYRFRDDKIVDHITGRSCTCKEFMRGNIDRLW